MKLIFTSTLLMMGIIALTTVWFVSLLKPTSTVAFVFFAVWLTFPYATMSVALILLRHKHNAYFHRYIVAAIVSIVGILFLADTIFWHADAQGAITVLITPILQAGALGLLLLVAWLVSKNA